MSTTIEWTDETWNPVTGCTKVSQGCKHCYAERVFPRAYGTRRMTGILNEDGTARNRKFTDVQTHPDRLDKPLRWKKPKRIFVNSMSDLFHEAVPFEFIDEVFAVMAICSEQRYRCHRRDCNHSGGCFITSGPGDAEPIHTFQILTKRPARMLEYFSTADRRYKIVDAADRIGWINWDGDLIEDVGLPLPNVQLGVSCEDQDTFDERVALLSQIPAAVHFVSLEPLLGDIDCGNAFDDPPDGSPYGKLDWVIVGGESGRGARPCNIEWIRSIVAQCKAAGVACFVKQMGSDWARGIKADLMNHGQVTAEWADAMDHWDSKGGDPYLWSKDLRVRDLPKS